MVSETITLLLSGDTARTFPGDEENPFTVLLPLTSITARPLLPSNPELVPAYAFAPMGSNTSEFGVAGKMIGVASFVGEVVSETTVLTQASTVPQPELDT